MRHKVTLWVAVIGVFLFFLVVATDAAAQKSKTNPDVETLIEQHGVSP